jgi:mannonate dehydratase
MLRLSIDVASEVKREQLAFASQLGVECAYTWVNEHQTSLDDMRSIKSQIEEDGLSLYMMSCMAYGKSKDIHLALPDRDRVIEDYQRFVQHLGEIGVTVTTFTWEPDAVWTTNQQGSSRGAPVRYVDLDELTTHGFTHGRAYDREELWDNFAYFMEKMTPVLRQAGVRLALHPNDPPTVESLGGVPCLIHGRTNYDRAFSHAPSGVLGMEFCCGCWLEGTGTFGDIPDGIRHFAADDRILIVHFRNISAPLPAFTETFLDNGFADMYPFMRTFVEVGYQGTITLDHTPQFPEPYHVGAGTGYAVGYMRALLERAKAELG